MTTLREILRNLVAFNTVSHKATTEAIAYLRQELEPLGFACEAFGGNGFLNLIARNEAAIRWNREGRSHVALCGHIDTVPFDRELWTSDPLSLEERDGRLYGVGAADMTGPLASMIRALMTLAVSRPDLPLALVVTHHEETALEGARELVATPAALDALRTLKLVIGEPTGLAIGHAHKGVFDFTITIEGKAAHSGNPHHGLNAIYGASAVARTIAAIDEEWKTSSAVERNTVNVGTIRSGDVRNRVPDFAVLRGDMRIVPGSTSELLTDLVELQLAVLRSAGYRCQLIRDYEAAPFEMSPDSGLIASMVAILGTDPIRLGYATDASVFQADAGIDCVIFGPGDIRSCHMPDECIEIAQLERGVEAYLAVLSRGDDPQASWRLVARPQIIRSLPNSTEEPQ
jgi:acetylornithine deacetylase